MPDEMAGVGTRFNVHLSAQNNTEENVNDWSVTVVNGGREEKIVSPESQMISSRFGSFLVFVSAAGPDMAKRSLEPKAGSETSISAGPGELVTVTIESTDDSGNNAEYWLG